MTTDKARKRAVRTRMQKTGERYAAARRHVVADPVAPAVRDAPGEAGPTAAPLLPTDFVPPSSETAIRNATGRGWEDWARALDAWGATGHTHTEIARHVAEAFAVPGWWAQNVTVGYERARGMRAVHQTTRGFEANVSKTLDAPVAQVWPLLAEARRRAAWVEPGSLEHRSETTNKRVTFRASDGSSVLMSVAPKGDDRCVVVVTHSKLADADDVARHKVAWRDRLQRLAAAVRQPDVAARRRQAS